MTTSYLLPSEWRALLTKYTIGAALVCLGLFIAGMRCEHHLMTRPDPAVALEAAHTKELEDSIDVLRIAKDSIAIETHILRARLAVDSTRAIALHAEASRRDSGIVIDTTALVKPEGTAPTNAIDSSSVDTVAYVNLQRPNDQRTYVIPKFFALSYLAQRADRQGLMTTVRDQMEVIAMHDVENGIHESLEKQQDSVIVSQGRQIAELAKRGHPWCGFKCGVVTTLATIIGAGVALHQVRR